MMHVKKLYILSNKKRNAHSHILLPLHELKVHQFIKWAVPFINQIAMSAEDCRLVLIVQGISQFYKPLRLLFCRVLPDTHTLYYTFIFLIVLFIPLQTEVSSNNIKLSPELSICWLIFGDGSRHILPLGCKAYLFCKHEPSTSMA